MAGLLHLQLIRVREKAAVFHAWNMCGNEKGNMGQSPIERSRDFGHGCPCNCKWYSNHKPGTCR